MRYVAIAGHDVAASLAELFKEDLRARARSGAAGDKNKMFCATLNKHLRDGSAYATEATNNNIRSI